MTLPDDDPVPRDRLGRPPVHDARRDHAGRRRCWSCTMRDIIRCGLAMIVCFAALAGIYVIAGAPLVAAAQVLVYIGAISVLVLFAIMLTQTKAAPSRLVFQTQAGAGGDRWRAARGRHRARRRLDRPGRSPARVRSRPTRRRSPRPLFGDVRPAVRGRQRPAARGRRSAACSWPSASAGASTDAQRARRHRAVARRLPHPVGDPVRDRDVRLPRPAQRDQHADVDRADAQRASTSSIIAFGAFTQRRSSATSASVIALIVMAAAAAEATVGLAIVIAIYRNRKTPLVDEYDAMRQ